jgi:ribosomal protein S18 acetylase RimI-like enzyme
MANMQIRTARQEDHSAAIRVWQAANVARGVVPSRQRVDRVCQKLSEPDAVVLVGCVDEEARVMVLAEPWRGADGIGPVVAGRGHVSMVFVDPEHWGRGLGTAVLSGLHEVAEQHGWTGMSLWTRESNQRAQRLYLRAQYRPTGRRAELATTERVLEFLRTTRS